MIVCLPNCAYLSETSRMVAIYRALQARGAPVAMATHGGSHAWVLDREGIPYELLEPRMSDDRGRRLVAEGPGMGPPGQSMWTDDEIRRCAEAEGAYFASCGARAVVTGFQLTTLLSSRLADIPTVTSHAGSWVPPIFERKMLPPLDEPPLAIFRYLPRAIGRAFANSGPTRYKGHLGGFNRIAAELGVEPVPSFAALLCGDLTLVTEAPEILGIPAEEMAAWRPSGPGLRSSTRMRYAGPIYAQLDMPIPDRAAEFLEAPGPTAYVAITSSSPDLVRSVVGAVTDAGLRALVASTSHGLSDLASPSVVVEPFLPSHLVMPRVDVAVIGGGQGSVQTALASGTPFVGLPLQPEQEWNAHVAERVGAGRKVPPRAVRRDLSRIVGEMARDPNAKSAAVGVAATYARIDGPAEAAQSILDLVAA
jgi:UDP:flavonoid glycosyltransferase YjiC (YdhE family)